ncbi:MAG: class I SAM-dependent methyltransferase [Phycisphaerae bacterium]
MDHDATARLWEQNAETWTQLTRAGYDTCRTSFNTPRFLEALPPVSTLRGLDIGCGEGCNTRAVAALGPHMDAVDVSPTFIRHASRTEADRPLGIRYHVASAHALPFDDATFDFAVAFMSFMDIPDPDKTFAEARRVLKPGGFLQFSILHPCFCTRLRRWITEDGRRVGVLCGEYWNNDPWAEEWTFGAAPPEVRQQVPKFRTVCVMRTMSQWVNTLLAAGFRLDWMGEPRPTVEEARGHRGLESDRTAANFLHIRAIRD